VESDSFRFRVGSIECLAVSDGTFTYPTSAFIANAPLEIFEQELRNHDLPSREILSSYTCLLINTGRNQLLVDTGAGFAPTNGKLLRNLETLGIKAEDIDTVVLTHGHADHIGANTDDTGRVAFPNARFVMWRDEWEFWTQDEPNLAPMQVDSHIKHLLIEFAHRKLPPIREQLELLDHDVEIVPGVHAIAAPGHTPGHMAVSVSDGNEQLLHMVDTVLHPILMEHPDWYSAVDLLPAVAVATKRQILDRAANDRALVMAFHFPFPGLGHVVSNGKGWQWHPIDGTR
jgi:glyoxylase-like metal-dependent hydrolase (beta-lactamase superfamily II)